MPATVPDLWSLVQNRQYVDPGDLAAALEEQAAHPPLDFRTRLLIRDSVEALRRHWGHDRFAGWLGSTAARATIEGICREDLGKPGFPFLGKQLMATTRPETVRQLLQELGNELHHT